MADSRITRLLALLVWGGAIAACGSSSGGNGSDNGSGARRFVAFNTGLNAWIHFQEERRPAVLDALENLETDVLCLSGVYDEQDAKAIISRLQYKLPYVHQEKTSDSSEKKVYCTNGDALITTQKCNQDNCIPIGLSLGDCVTTVCREYWDALSPECLYCLSAHPDDPISCLAGGAQTYGMEGGNGLILLSRYPIQDASFSQVDSVAVKRGLLSGTIAEMTVHCTLMPMDLPQLPYPEDLLPFSSWEEEHRAFVQETIQVAGSDGCTVLMGDLGAGPASPAAAPPVEAHFGENYQLLIGAGFKEPWPDRECTLCRNNPLVRPATDRQVDHVLVKGCPDFGSLQYTRIFDTPLKVTDREGNDHVTSLSGNYGVLLEVL